MHLSKVTLLALVTWAVGICAGSDGGFNATTPAGGEAGSSDSHGGHSKRDPCGTSTLTPEELERLAAKEEAWSQEVSKNGKKKGRSKAKVRVYVHIMTDENGFGDVSDAVIVEQINVLKGAFNGGDIGRFLFKLKSIQRHANSDWRTKLCTPRGAKAFKKKLRKGKARDLNIYICEPSDGLLGWAAFPWEYRNDRAEDGVVILTGTLPGGSERDYNEGDILTHEVGHWLGLFHTFQGGCSNTRGDLVSDTPAQEDPNYGCPSFVPDSCTGDSEPDPINNYMDYTDDKCIDHFTEGQFIRMLEQWVMYRQKVKKKKPKNKKAKKKKPVQTQEGKQ